MPFREAFEKKLNDDMQDDGNPDHAPTETRDFEMDQKKDRSSPQLDLDDEELHEKKDRPPRFSTLFGGSPQSQPREYQREYFPRAQRKSGVFMPMPLFVIFAVILFFESTILFAYTVIGLYNNAPSRIFPWAGPGTTSACDYQEKQAAINFAPNFVMPQANQPVTTTVEADKLPEVTSITSSTSSTSTTSSSTSTVNSSSQAAAIASEVASILSSLTSSTSIPVVVSTVFPTQSVVTSVALLTVDPAGSTLTPIPTPTVTETSFVNPAKTTSSSSTSSTSSTATHSTAASSESTTHTTATSTQEKTSTTPTATPSSKHSDDDSCTQEYDGYDSIGKICPS